MRSFNCEPSQGTLPLIATMTLARGADEEALIARALQHASGAGFSVIVSDGGSSEAFLSDIREIPRVSVLPAPAPGLVAQIKHAMSAAIDAGAQRVLYTEPDKAAFLEQHVDYFLTAATDPVTLVVAARTRGALSTFPEIQQFTESTINELTSEAVGMRGDYSYGPLLLPRRAAEYVLRAPERLGWGWRHFVLAVAHRAGIPIALHLDDYSCPPSQRDQPDGERIHRLKQLSQNIDGLAEGLTFEI